LRRAGRIKGGLQQKYAGNDEVIGLPDVEAQLAETRQYS
jgi:hypothetical protein